MDRLEEFSFLNFRSTIGDFSFWSILRFLLIEEFSNCLKLVLFMDLNRVYPPLFLDSSSSDWLTILDFLLLLVSFIFEFYLRTPKSFMVINKEF